MQASIGLTPFATDDRSPPIESSDLASGPAHGTMDHASHATGVADAPPGPAAVVGHELKCPVCSESVYRVPSRSIDRVIRLLLPAYEAISGTALVQYAVHEPIMNACRNQS